MPVQSLQRTDIVRVAPHSFFRVVAAVLPKDGTPADLQLLLQPLEGGGAKQTTLAAFNATYPDAVVEYANQVAYHQIQVSGTYRSASGMICHVLEFTVDLRDCIALVRFRQMDGHEEIVSTDEFRELFPNEVQNIVH